MRRRQFPLTLLAPLAARAARQETSYAAQFPDMLVQHLAGKINTYTATRDAERARISTPSDIHARNRYVRQAMTSMIHGLPQRTPLAPAVTGSFARKGYRVENVMFQSRPDFWVTGNLYIPTTAPGPFPGIISPCGHYNDARMEPEYQAAYINLVLAGFVVLAYDPIGQGERRQYWNPATGITEVGGPTTEHSMVGQLLLMVGEDLTHYRVWDGMRAIDYLLTRPEVDPKRIGCTGHSGGGTLTRFIAALDERVQVAVINEGGTADRWPLHLAPEARLGPSDVEQNLFPGAKLGVDHVDMQIAVAPRPLLVLIEDFFPRFNEAVERIEQRYRQLGVPERFAAEQATDPHSWTPKLRLATTRWFSRWFYGKPGPDREPDFDTEPLERLFCTPNGSLRYSRRGHTIYDLLHQKLVALPPKSALTKQKLSDLLSLPTRPTELGVRLLTVTERKGYNIEKLEFLSEPGIYIPTWVFLPPQPAASGPALLWVDERGKEAEGVEFKRLEKLTRAGRIVVAVDVRGIGGTRPPHASASNRQDDFTHLFDVETAMTYLGWYAGVSLVGMRVFDVLRAVDYALSRPDIAPRGIEVTGRGAGAIWSLMAAALDPRIRAVTAERMLVSYKTLALTDRYTHNASIMLKDGLLHGDLPQIAALAAPRPVTLIEPVDAMKRPAAQPDVAREWSGVANVKLG